MKLSERGSTYALFTIVVLGAAFGGLSQTALNVMIIQVAGDFSVGIDIAQWLTTLYILVMGIVVPITTFLDRRLNDRQYVLVGLAFFLVGAVLAAFSPWFWLLVVGRVLQAISAGILIPVNQNIAMHRFPPGRQATAMGVAGIALGFAPNIGPTVGSFFVSALSWRAFFVALIIATVVLVAVTLLLVPYNELPPSNLKLDLPSFGLSAIAFGGLLAGLSNASTYGVVHLLTWLPVVLGIVFLVLFVRREQRIDNPLINLALFKSRRFRVGFWLQNFLFGSFMGITLAIPLYVEKLCGGTPADAGLILLPAAVCALVCNPLGGILADRIGQARVIYGATAIMLAGSLLALTYTADSPIWYVALVQGIRGFGVSSAIGSSVTWTLRDLPKPLISHGSSFSLLVRQACASLGTTMMVFCVEMLPQLTGMSAEWSFHFAFGVSAVLAIGMAVVAFVFVRSVEREGDTTAR